ncbi:MAG: cell wall hydrolase [Eubacteriaceae bacterium]|nr:cell wall hydrolase [Eubacteriaceae bacterium]
MNKTFRQWTVTALIASLCLPVASPVFAADAQTSPTSAATPTTHIEQMAAPTPSATPSPTPEAAPSPSAEPAPTAENTDATVKTNAATPSVVYAVHTQNIGWMDETRDGVTAGTTGRCLRLEALRLRLDGMPYAGDIVYRSHIQNIGWESAEKSAGALSGTEGQGLQIEAVRIRLTGEIANHYDVYYRVHIADAGWLGWAKNGESAGSSGYGLRMEAIEVRLVPKGETSPIETAASSRKAFCEMGFDFNAHVQDIGWQDSVGNFGMVGTLNQSKRLEAIRLLIDDPVYAGNIRAMVHMQDIGWNQGWVDGGIAGTTGQGRRVEGVRLELTGATASKFDIYYRAHVQNIGWLGWAKNGQAAGSEGFSYRMEGLQVKIVPKGAPAPGDTNDTYRIYVPEIIIPNFDLICAVVQQEGGASYEGALAVITCIMNRADSGRWGGHDPVSVITAPGQFSAYLDGAYTRYLGCSSIAVQNAVHDCIGKGVRLHPFQSFRSYPTPGSTFIVNQWFF